MQLNLNLGHNQPLSFAKKREANSNAVLDYDNETRVETSAKDIHFLEPPPSVVTLSGNKAGSTDNVPESFCGLPMLARLRCQKTTGGSLYQKRLERLNSMQSGETLANTAPSTEKGSKLSDVLSTNLLKIDISYKLGSSSGGLNSSVNPK
jgi:hypothetical protein